MQDQGVELRGRALPGQFIYYKAHAQVAKSGDGASLTMTQTGLLGPSQARRQWVFRSGQVRTNQGFGYELLSLLAARFRIHVYPFSTTGACLYPRSSLQLINWIHGPDVLMLSCSYQCQQWSRCATAKEKDGFFCSKYIKNTLFSSFFWSQDFYQNHQPCYHGSW